MGAINRHALIYVFPDYTSTGLWIQPSGQSIQPGKVGVSSGLQMALKYWHSYWEHYLADSGDEELHEGELVNVPSYTKKLAIARWRVDGYELARLMTNENEEYEFNYKE